MRTPQFEFARRAGLLQPQVHTVAVDEEEETGEEDKESAAVLKIYLPESFSALDRCRLHSYHSVKCKYCTGK